MVLIPVFVALSGERLLQVIVFALGRRFASKHGLITLRL